MTPEQEAALALNLSRKALRLHERSRIAGWFGAAVWFRFRALLAEETAEGLRRKARRG
jgi:hypothetical protein